MTASNAATKGTPRLRVSFLLLSSALLLLLGYALALKPAEARPATSSPGSADCRRETRLVPSPNAGSGANRLMAVAAVPNHNDRVDVRRPRAWAVGHYLDNTGIERTLIQGWNGSEWAVVPSPNVGSNRNFLNGVAAAGPNEAWSVGFYWDASNLQHTMVLRWNGTEWSVAPTPSTGPYESYLNSVSVVSQNDVWAVGLYSPDWYAYRTVAMHWDGTEWSIVPTPNQPTRDNYLVSVSARGHDDVWAVGYYATDSRDDQKTLAVHWDGVSWTMVPSPNVGTGRNYLQGVASSGRDSAWAVGFYWNASNVQRTLTMRWNGKAWSVVPAPDASAHENYLTSVVADGRDVWAAGLFSPDMSRYQSLLMRWTGSGWQIVPSPNAGAQDNYLNGIALDTRRDVWAVGYSSNVRNDDHAMVVRSACSR